MRGDVKAELRSGAVVLGGGGELRWTMMAGGKSWSIVEARRVRRSRRRRVGRAEAWSSPQGGNGGGGSFTIHLETVGSGTGERTHGFGKSRGGGDLLRRVSACARKGGSGGGIGGSFWTEQSENKGRGSRLGAPCRGERNGGIRRRACSSEGGPVVDSTWR
jgi:hypothetical protein